MSPVWPAGSVNGAGQWRRSASVGATHSSCVGDRDGDVRYHGAATETLELRKNKDSRRGSLFSLTNVLPLCYELVLCLLLFLNVQPFRILRALRACVSSTFLFSCEKKSPLMPIIKLSLLFYFLCMHCHMYFHLQPNPLLFLLASKFWLFHLVIYCRRKLGIDPTLKQKILLAQFIFANLSHARKSHGLNTMFPWTIAHPIESYDQPHPQEEFKLHTQLFVDEV